MKTKLLLGLLLLAAPFLRAADPAPVNVQMTGDGTAKLLKDIHIGTGRTLYIDAGGTLQINGTINFTPGSITWASVSKSGSSLADLATRSAGDLSSGTLLAARLPAFSGDVTSSAGSAALTVTKVNGVSLAALGTGIVKNTTGTGHFSIALAGTDYAPATTGAAILYGNAAGGFSNVTIGTGLTFIAGTLTATGSGSGSVTTVSVVSANGLAGTVANAATTPAITLTTTITGLLKGNGAAISAAVASTDYAPATSGSSILYGNGSGGFASVTIGSGLTFVGGTLTSTSGGPGTVTSVSVVSTNGFGGMVATATSTPAITLTTSVTGLLKGDGTGVSAAVADTDYQTPLTFSTGLTNTGGTVTVNTSQSISKLSNLTSNGLVTTTGGDGTLGITTTPIALNLGGTNASLTASNGGIFYSTATAGAILAGTATANKVLMSSSSAAPVWSTPTYPNASATAGKVIRSDGTNYAASTSTFADTYAVSTLLYASSANTVAGLATANSGLLVTSVTGVPSIGTDIPTAVTIGTAYIYRVGGTDVAVADGGTGLSSGTSGGILGYTASGTLASSAALTANAIVIGGGAGATPTTTTTAANILTFIGTPSSANLAAALTDETGSGVSVFGTSPAFTTSITTGSTTFALFNATATTVNAFGATTTLNLGASATMILNFGGSTTASEFRFLEPSGSGVNYTAFKAGAQAGNVTYTWPSADGSNTYVLQTNGSGVLSWVAAATGSGTVTVVSSGSLTSTAIVTGGGTTTLQTPSATSTLDSSGNMVLAGSLTTGSGGTAAGFVALGQGSAPSAGTTAVTLYAPTSVTSYGIVFPGTAGTGIYLGTNSSGVVTLTQLSTTGSGNVVLASAASMTSPDVTTSITTPSTTFALLNATATTVNAFAATTTLNIGASATLILNFGGSTTASELRFLEPSGSGTNYVGFKAAAMAGNTTYTWPNADGSNTNVLQTNGSGVLSWVAAGSGSGTVTVVASGALTSTALVTGGGTTTLQTPSTTSTLDSSGNMILAGNLTLGASTSSITGAAGNMTITAGTGASRTITLRTTTAGGTSTAALTLNADQTATFTAGLTATAVTDSGLTAGRVTFAGTSGLLADDADMTFSVDTLTVTKIGVTSFSAGFTASGAGANDFSGASGTFKTSTGANTISGAATFNSTLTMGGTALSFGALPSGATTAGTLATFSAQTYTVTGTNTATAFQGIYHGVVTVTDASAGTVTDLFSENWAGPATNAGSLVVTRKHTLGVLDSTSAASSVTGAFIVAATYGTTATSVGIGGGNINAGGTGTFGGTLSVTGHVTFETVTSTGATGTNLLVFATSPTITTPVFASGNTASGSGANTWAGSTGTFITSTGLNTLSGRTTIGPPIVTSGVTSYLTVTTPADTGLTASTESIGVSFTAATRQWATGALTTQREHVFAAPTYAFVGASTLTTAINVDIADPIAGTNGTLTNKYGLRANNVQITGTLTANTGTNQIGPLVDSVDGSTPLNNLVETTASGTAYTLTTSYAALDFGTTDPVIVLPNAGTYWIMAWVQTTLASATTTTQTVSFKMRRTNNTAADLGDVSSQPLPVATTASPIGPSATMIATKYTTTNTNDSITIQGLISASTGAGSVTCTQAHIIAGRVY